jgi:hypothetical protein
MKLFVIIAAAFYFPLMTIGALAAMIYAKRGRARNPNGLRELIVVAAPISGGLIAGEIAEAR